MENMFCYQCQETAKNSGCTISGVCGKTPEVSNLQDDLLLILKEISEFSTKLDKNDYDKRKVGKFVTDSLFMTITNANFDANRFTKRISEANSIKEGLKAIYTSKGGDLRKIITEQTIVKAGVLSTENEDVRSLRELTIYGLKGMAAYAEHAYNLGFEDEQIYDFMQTALVKTLDDSLNLDELTSLVLQTGEFGVKAMSMLDKANTTSYGNPEITKVNLGVGKNPGILISGHDLKDMEELLRQTENSGVDVYTHSEMLPANYYPAFKKYKHFVGNYGGAWWSQVEDFKTFNGPILFTTNCIVPPRSNSGYSHRVYTTGASGFPGFNHIEDRVGGLEKDFTQIIEHAKRCQPPIEIEKGEIVGGFAHNQVTQLAEQIVEAVKSGAIKKFFVMAGCDGRMKGRSYYTEFAEKLPKDTVILTAGCAKYRYNKLPLGDINGIPRVLDAGQCNDSYSLAVIALKLKEIFNKSSINELPIAYNIAWYEQKAVIVLLALLYLGVKNIHLGPTLPAFLSPNVANVLVNNFGISGIGTVDADIELFMS